MLQLLQPVPAAARAGRRELVQSGYREYQELMLVAPRPEAALRLTLTLTLLLALLSAVGARVRAVGAPVGAAQRAGGGHARGGAGRLQPARGGGSTDELGVLTQSFNSMTQQLAERAPRPSATRPSSRRRRPTWKAYSPTSPPACSRSTRTASALGQSQRRQRYWAWISAPLLELRARALERGRARAGGARAACRDGVRRAADRANGSSRSSAPHRGGTQQLLLRGTRLPPGTHGGYVVVFDDITHLAQAQRAAAWAEVARRLAHEITNPLTPIQLSAERLQAKLAGKLAGADAEMLARSTQTIVNQVAALKSMVDAFSQYARTPEPSMRELDLNALTREVLTLYESSLGRTRAPRARAGAAAHRGRRGATAAGHPQPAAERAGRAGRHRADPRVTHRDRGGGRAGSSSP